MDELSLSCVGNNGNPLKSHRVCIEKQPNMHRNKDGIFG